MTAANTRATVRTIHGRPVIGSFWLGARGRVLRTLRQDRKPLPVIRVAKGVYHVGLGLKGKAPQALTVSCADPNINVYIHEIRNGAEVRFVRFDHDGTTYTLEYEGEARVMPNYVRCADDPRGRVDLMWIS